MKEKKPDCLKVRLSVSFRILLVFSIAVVLYLFIETGCFSALFIAFIFLL